MLMRQGCRLCSLAHLVHPSQTPEEERKRLLSFVVCGGGPTGVEVAAEMHDMIFDDLKVSQQTPEEHAAWQPVCCCRVRCIARSSADCDMKP